MFLSQIKIPSVKGTSIEYTGYEEETLHSNSSSFREWLITNRKGRKRRKIYSFHWNQNQLSRVSCFVSVKDFSSIVNAVREERSKLSKPDQFETF